MTRIIHQPPHQAWTFAPLRDALTRYNITPWVVAHIGAHHGEEVAIYRDCGFEEIVLVEPDPRSVAVLREHFTGEDDVIIIDRACVPQPVDGEVTLYTAQRTVWSGLHPHPTADGGQCQVGTIVIGDLLEDVDINVLVLDTQGSELDLLRAANLQHLELIIVETTRRPDDGAALYDDAAAYMQEQGWTAVEEWVHDNSGYTDTIFIRA